MKKLIKKLITTGLLLCMTAGTVLFAAGLENKNAIGMYILGGERGIGGIQYERRFNDLLSLKTGVFAMYHDNTSYFTDKDAEFNIILEPDFTLYETDWNDKVASRLFAFGLAGYDFEMGTDTIWDENHENSLGEQTNIIHSAVLAAGFGFDFIFFGHLSVPIQFGFMGIINTDSPNVGFCGGIALRYAW